MQDCAIFIFEDKELLETSIIFDMVSKEDFEKLKRLNEARDCLEFVKVLDIKFPIHPEGLDLEKFLHFGWEKFKAYDFDDDSAVKLLYWTRLLTRNRQNGKINVTAIPLNSVFKVENMLEKSKTIDEFNKLIGKLKAPSREIMEHAENESIGVFSAVYLGKDDIIRKMIAEDPACVNKKNRYGWTPLHYAMCIGCSDAATILIKNGADPNAYSTDHVRPMVLGAKWGHRATVYNVCQSLLECKGEDFVKNLLRTPDSLNRHPLHYAAESKQHVVCDVLLNFGADPNFQDNKGRSATFLACKTGNLDTIRVLYKKWGGNIRLQDKEKRTPYDVFPKDKKLLEGLKLNEDEENQMDEN